MKVDRLAILGVGLLGGSVALAARSVGVVGEIVGYDLCQQNLQQARQRQMIDQVAGSPASAVADASLVVLAVPVDRIVPLLREIVPHCHASTLLTDVGSTKGFVREAETVLSPGVNFIGSHPMAGSEKAGPLHAQGNLFRGRRVVLTPTEQTRPAALDRLEQFWQTLGADVVCMTPEDHDQAVAWTSHLPHLVAYALAGCLPPEHAPLVASGFRDATRLAGSDPQLWRSIFDANRPALLEAVAGFKQHFAALEAALRTGNNAALVELLQQGKVSRDAAQ